MTLCAVRVFGILLVAVLLTACQTTPPNEGAAFSIERQNPPTLVDPTLFGYSQVTTVNGGRMVFLAGQGPTNADGKPVGRGDLLAQTRQAVDNILAALESVGAGPENIVYLRYNVVDYSPKLLIQLAPELQRLNAEGDKPPSSIFVGVDALIVPGTLIEIETIAAIP